MVFFDKGVEAALERGLPNRQQAHLRLGGLEQVLYSAHRFEHFAVLYQQLLLGLKAAESCFLEREHQTHRVHVILLQICRDASPENLLNVVRRRFCVRLNQRTKVFEVRVSVVNYHQQLSESVYVLRGQV